MLLLIATILFSCCLIGKKSRIASCDWFIQLSDNRYLIAAFCYRRLPIDDFAVRFRKNRLLNEPIRFEEIAIFIEK